MMQFYLGRDKALQGRVRSIITDSNVMTKVRVPSV